MRIYNKKLFAALFLTVFISGCNGCGGNNGGGALTNTSVSAVVIVSSTNPIDIATGVAINKKIAAVFSEEMDPLTITTTTFQVTGPGSTPVTGTVAYALVGNVATFTPGSDLAPNTTFTATITMGAADLAGNALTADYVWSFTTGATADNTAPLVSSTNPLDSGVGVSINGNMAVTFGEALDPTTCTTTTFTVMQGTTPVSGTVACVGSVATFNPTSDLIPNTTYTATITTEATDLADNALAGDYVWSFTTGATADNTAPLVSSTNPLDSGVGVSINGNMAVTFDEALDPATITTATFTLNQGATPVSGTVTSVGSVATFNPTSDLAASTVYTATITTGATDLAGNALAADKGWSFTTGAAAAAGPAPIVLGTSGAFAILTKTGVTDVPASSITGNIGTSPITGAAIAGLGCPEVTGTIYTVDAAGPACRVTDATLLTTAIGDMEIAYTDAAGRSIPDATELGAGEIGGLTIIPGLYKWSSNVLITTDVTLSGGANDVWIFQISGDLIQANGKSVNLVGGAQAKNIFWQVAGGTGVSLGTTAHFEGTILATKAINLGTGASVNGRLLAQTAVTLQQNAVTKP